MSTIEFALVDVDDMLAAIGKTDGSILRQPLNASDFDSLDADLRRVPEASLGPSVAGQQAVDASAGHGEDRTR